jgi:hypothetical protein
MPKCGCTLRLWQRRNACPERAMPRRVLESSHSSRSSAPLASSPRPNPNIASRHSVRGRKVYASAWLGGGPRHYGEGSGRRVIGPRHDGVCSLAHRFTPITGSTWNRQLSTLRCARKLPQDAKCGHPPIHRAPKPTPFRRPSTGALHVEHFLHASSRKTPPSFDGYSPALL